MMTTADYRHLTEQQRICLRLDRFCDGNWAARFPGLRDLVTVSKARKMRRICDGA